MSIAAEDADLAKLVDRDGFRASLNSMSESYEKMTTYINNIESDLRSIESYADELHRQEEQGYNVGSSLATLTFQRGQLKTDLDFFQSMKALYLKRIYADLFSFCETISAAAATIEPRQPGESVDDLKTRKMSAARAFDDASTYTMNDNFSILSLSESLLLELASDIASFTPKIVAAEQRQQRGFQVGSLITQLTSQQLRLKSEFTSQIAMIKGFLETNARFASRCLNRIQMISNEIVTAEEQQQDQQQDQEQDPPADAA